MALSEEMREDVQGNISMALAGICATTSRKHSVFINNIIVIFRK
jgi:hypothetical protein